MWTTGVIGVRVCCDLRKPHLQNGFTKSILLFFILYVFCLVWEKDKEREKEREGDKETVIGETRSEDTVSALLIIPIAYIDGEIQNL